jgi:hypothetical protein
MTSQITEELRELMPMAKDCRGIGDSGDTFGGQTGESGARSDHTGTRGRGHGIVLCDSTEAIIAPTVG